MANTSIVTTEAEAVNLLDTTRAAYDAAVIARTAAFQATLQANTTAEQFHAVRSALVAQERARVAWTAASDALIALWRAQDESEAEEARLQAMCEAHDAYEWGYDGFDDHAYQLTPEGVQYLDYHYATHPTR